MLQQTDEVADFIHERRSDRMTECVTRLREAGFTVERTQKQDGSGPADADDGISIHGPHGPCLGWITPATSRVSFRLPREKCPVIDYTKPSRDCPVLIFPSSADWEYQVYMIVTHARHVSAVVEQYQRALEHYEAERLA